MANLERQLEEAQARLRAAVGGDLRTVMAAYDALHDAERAVAGARGEPYAEPMDFEKWDGGAPLPHLVAGSAGTFVVCRASVPDPNWDGTYATLVSPGDETPSPLLIIEAVGCAEVRLGGPNDEALRGHPLHGRGLGGYGVYKVHNSEWIEHAIKVNSVHPHHSDERFRRLHHYVLVFHDEMVEALALSLTVTREETTMRGALAALLERVTS